MKIKSFVTISLGFYIFSALTILILGLLILPKDQKVGIKLSKEKTINEPTKIAQDTNTQPSSAPTQIDNPSSATNSGSPTVVPSPTPAQQIQATSNTNSSTTTTPSNNTGGGSAGGSGAGTGTGSGTGGGSGGSTTPPPPTPPPPVVAKCGESGGACTASEVAVHNTASDCWVIFNKDPSVSATSSLNNGYYIITPYSTNSASSKHPAGGGKPGVKVFNSDTCGQDFSDYFYGKKATAGYQQNHKGFGSAISILKSYYIGPVK